MHLGHEVKFFKYAILSIYTGLMLYTIFIVLTEGTYAGSSGKFTKVDPIFVQQQADLKAGHHAGHAGSDAHHGHDAVPADHEAHH
jgi:hypothetical protein